MDDQKPIIIGRGNKKWKATAIIMIVLAIIFAGASGFFIWRFFDQKAEIDNLNSEISQIKPESDDGQATKDDGENTKDNWLVVDQWGIKFEIPSGLYDVKYEIENRDDGSYLYFSSKQMDEKCDAGTASGSIGAMGRYTTEEYYNISSEMPSVGARVNVRPIDGYIFTYSHPQATCSADEATQALQTEQIDLVQQLVDTMRAI